MNKTGEIMGKIKGHIVSIETKSEQAPLYIVGRAHPADRLYRKWVFGRGRENALRMTEKKAKKVAKRWRDDGGLAINITRQRMVP